MSDNSWEHIAQQNQALLTKAIEKLSKAERQRDAVKADLAHTKKLHSAASARSETAERALGALKALEWGDPCPLSHFTPDIDPELDSCFVCGNCRGEGHAKDCRWTAALAAGEVGAS